MRPGQSCPGVAGGDPALTLQGRGFNEAGAIMPRSGESGIPGLRLVALCFNEAGAIMPRSGGGT